MKIYLAEMKNGYYNIGNNNNNKTVITIVITITIAITVKTNNRLQ